MNDEKPNDHPGDMGFNNAPQCYKCSVCGEEYWNRPSIEEGAKPVCGECYQKIKTAVLEYLTPKPEGE